MPQVVVEHEGADPDPGGGECSRGQSRERRASRPEVIAYLKDVEAGGFGRVRRPDDLYGISRGFLQAEAKSPHGSTLSIVPAVSGSSAGAARSRLVVAETAPGDLSRPARSSRASSPLLS